MEYVVITMFGIFVGIATASYMFVNELNKKERLILNQKAMIKNRDAIIDEQNQIVNKIKRILKADKIFTEKYDKIKELFANDNQDK